MKKGVGDTIAAITKATGIDKAVKAVVGEDCGCKERQERLNQMFPYYTPLSDADMELIKEHLKPAWDKAFITRDETHILWEIYDRTFRKPASRSSCKSCRKEQLRRIIEVYEQSCTSQEAESK